MCLSYIGRFYLFSAPYSNDKRLLKKKSIVVSWAHIFLPRNKGFEFGETEGEYHLEIDPVVNVWITTRNYRRGFDIRSIRLHVAQRGVHCLTNHISREQELRIERWALELTSVFVHECALIEIFLPTIAHDVDWHHSDGTGRSFVERFPKFFSFIDGAAL